MKDILTLLLFFAYNACSAQIQPTSPDSSRLRKEVKVEYVSNENGESKKKIDTLTSSYESSMLETNSIAIDSVFGIQEIKDERIDLLIKDYVENKEFIGYRIQIYSSRTRWEAQKIRSQFLKKYNEEKNYLIYQAPNFKVRVGDYHNRLEAHKRLEILRVDFPSAFIVKDEIKPELKQ